MLCDISVTSSKNPLLDLKPRKKGHHDGDALKNQKKVYHSTIVGINSIVVSNMDVSWQFKKEKNSDIKIKISAVFFNNVIVYHCLLFNSLVWAYSAITI